MTYIMISWSFFTTRASHPWNKEAYVSIWQPYLDTPKNPKSITEGRKTTLTLKKVIRWKLLTDENRRGFPPHTYLLLKQIHPRFDFPQRKGIASISLWLCQLMLGLPYLWVKVHGAGQTASAIAEGCFATAEGHTVVFSLFEPDSTLPVWIVMDPTAAQLENQTGKEFSSNCNTQKTSILWSSAEKYLRTTYLNTSRLTDS